MFFKRIQRFNGNFAFLRIVRAEEFHLDLSDWADQKRRTASTWASI